MAKSANNNNNMSMSASELARVLTETITQTFVNLGIVQVIAHPSSVPSQVNVTGAKVTKPQAQVSAPSVRKAQGNAVAPVTRAQAQTSQARVTHPQPNFGDDSCVVGENRTKLPKGIFDGFEGIVLRFADGREHGIKTDVEGRGRLTRNQTDDIGAYHSEGHHLVFVRDEEFGNVYDVHIWAEGTERVRRAHVAPAVAVPQVAPVKAGQGQGNGKGSKKPATQAQLAARAKFSQRAKAGEFRKGNRQQDETPTLFRVSDEVEQVTDEDFDEVRTVVAAPSVSSIRVRPLYVVPPRKR
jgi:hypothetical protein